jgi:hypothetical protein
LDFLKVKYQSYLNRFLSSERAHLFGSNLFEVVDARHKAGHDEHGHKSQREITG